MQAARSPGSIIQDRYHLIKVLGQGGSGITYQAEDQSTGHCVAIKELSLKGLSDWKKLELFEREAEVLAGLDHPAIPNYVDYFQIDFADDRCFYIVQALAEGQSLASLVAHGVRFTEADVRLIALEILQILEYLHGLNPPIIHRDIKPQNIIYRDDGQVFLVDFGAVQTVYQHTVAFRSTIVGTYGYMAPEQFRGKAHVNTDLYGLGTTLLYLLSHQSPADLPQTRLKYDFRPYVNVSTEFANWLEGLLEPLVEDRFETAIAARNVLNNPELLRSPPVVTTPQQYLPQPQRKPVRSRVQLVRTPTHLSLKIPALGFRRGRELKLTFWAIAATGIAFVGYLLFSAVVLGTPNAHIATLYFGIVVFVILGLLINAFFGVVTLEMSPDRFAITRQVFDWQYSVTEGNTQKIRYIELRAIFAQNGRPVTTIAMREGQNFHKFGTQLSTIEKKWLAFELDSFLRANNPFWN